MPTWAWAVIAVALVALLALVIWQLLVHRQTTRLQKRFGPEYDRAVEAADSKRQAEAELRAREERRQQLEIRPLTQTARDRYISSWRVIQGRFVDDPRSAVARADKLIQSVMAGRGYPLEDFDQRAADVSVDYPSVVDNYREGHRLANASAGGTGATEDLRQAMRHYRALFDELVEPDADQPLAAERGDATERADASSAARNQNSTSTRKV